MNEEWEDRLYELVDEDYDIEDLVGVCKTARRNGFVAGRNSLKGLLRECYNAITNSTGLDGRKVVTESSLARRVREAVNE